VKLKRKVPEVVFRVLDCTIVPFEAVTIKEAADTVLLLV